MNKFPFAYYGVPMMGYGFSWFGAIFMILFWILVIAGIIVIIRWILNKSRATISAAHCSHLLFI